MNNTLRQKHGFSYAKYGYLFSIPFFIAFLVFNLYPTLYTVLLPFSWALPTARAWATSPSTS